ncbi:MAG TPA: hypothetical protein GXZ36_08840, partial [Firmicutes bacterium]|nr:hypothetical protein [Bacillota bacterium]
MKRKVLLFTLFHILLSTVFTMNTRAQAVTVKAHIDQEVYEVGEFVTLKVFVDENPGLHSLFFDLTYEGSVLEFVNLHEGGLVTGEKQPGEFLFAVSDPVTSNVRGDHLIVSYALQGAETETKRTGLLCEIRFRVK